MYNLSPFLALVLSKKKLEIIDKKMELLEKEFV